MLPLANISLCFTIPHFAVEEEKKGRPWGRSCNAHYARARPISTPMLEAIISPLVQPLESPKQCSPLMLVIELLVHLDPVE